MPQCFQLFRKGESEPFSLHTVDSELCELLGVPVHPRFYVAGWFDCIGFNIAMGKALGSPELRAEIASYPEPGDLIRCLDYLESRYSSTAFYQSKGSNRHET